MLWILFWRLLEMKACVLWSCQMNKRIQYFKCLLVISLDASYQILVTVSNHITPFLASAIALHSDNQHSLSQCFALSTLSRRKRSTNSRGKKFTPLKHRLVHFLDVALSHFLVAELSLKPSAPSKAWPSTSSKNRLVNLLESVPTYYIVTHPMHS